MEFFLDTAIPPVTDDEINAERDRRIAAGFDFDMPGYGRIAYQGRDRDQTNFLALKDTARDLLTAGVESAVIPFRDRANADHLLTAEQVVALVDRGKAWVSATYRASWALKALVPIPLDYRSDEWWHPDAG